MLNALHKPKEIFLEPARKYMRGGGSLTIISIHATLYDDWKVNWMRLFLKSLIGTGNSEIVLDRSISDKKNLSGINITKSGTRKEELLSPS